MLLTAIRSDRFSEVLPGVSDSTGHSIRHSYVRAAHKRHAVTRGQHPLSISGNLGNILTPFGAKRVMSLRHGECDPACVPLLRRPRPPHIPVLRHSHFLFPVHHTTLRISPPPGHLHNPLAETSFVDPTRPCSYLRHRIPHPAGFCPYSCSAPCFTCTRSQYHHDYIHPIYTNTIPNHLPYTTPSRVTDRFQLNHWDTFIYPHRTKGSW